MAAFLIIAILVILGAAAWYAFQHAEPPPHQVNEEFKRRRAAGLVRDDTGRNPDQEVPRFRWWSR